MKKQKLGIILAAGRNSRLYPESFYVPKAFATVYNRPAIYYAIAQLFACGVNLITVVCNEADRNLFEKLANKFNNGKVKISITTQVEPKGPIDALDIGFTHSCKEFKLGDCKESNVDNVYLYFADNVFTCASSVIPRAIKDFADKDPIITLVTIKSDETDKFGCLYKLVYTNEDGSTISKYELEEKPSSGKYMQYNPNPNPRKELGGIITGFYVYSNKDNRFCNNLSIIKAMSIPNYTRNITDFNELFIDDVNDKGESINIIDLSPMGIPFPMQHAKKWFDIGTGAGLASASSAVMEFENALIPVMKRMPGYPEIEGLIAGFYDVSKDVDGVFKDVYDENYSSLDYTFHVNEAIRTYKEFRPSF